MFLSMFRIAVSRPNPVMMIHRRDLLLLSPKAVTEIRTVILAMDRANVRRATARVGTVRRSETISNVRIANTASPACAAPAMAGGKSMA